MITPDFARLRVQASASLAHGGRPTLSIAIRAPSSFPNRGKHSRWLMAAALILALALHALAILLVNLPPPTHPTQPAAIDILFTQAGGATGVVETDELNTPASPSSHRDSTIHQSFDEARRALADPTEVSVEQAPADGEGPVYRIDQQPPEDRPWEGMAAAQLPTADPAQVSAAIKEQAATRERPDYAELAKTIASSHTQRQLGQSGGAVRSRSKRLTNASAQSAVELAYLEMWQKKVERIGRANYPPGRLAGELAVLAVIGYDGALREARILESSGHPALDEAALRIVRLAAPFSHFPTDLRKNYDRLEIVRQWRFERRGGSFR